MKTPFDDLDYTSWLEGSRESAEVTVPLLMELVGPRSVVDVGCGLGAWLATFSEQGVTDILGIDGPWVDRTILQVPQATFQVADLNEPLDDIGRRFDLALCLEMAHLLRASAAEQLVLTLTSLSDVVAFSAAIPGQGGIGHLNEQWPHYWSDLFAAHGYVATDPLRARLWEEPAVNWWFAQNIVGFVDRQALDRYPALDGHSCATGHPLPLVHPRRFASLVNSLSGREHRSVVNRARVKAMRVGGDLWKSVRKSTG